jgi:hypothetical protein
MADGSYRRGRGDVGEQVLGALIAHEISAAVVYCSIELSAARSRPIEYLRGEMNDTPSRPNSSDVTADLADTFESVCAKSVI